MSSIRQVQFNESTPIPDQLEELAKDIREGRVIARTVLCVVDGGPELNLDHYCFGYRPRKSETVGLLTVAALDFLGVKR